MNSIWIGFGAACWALASIAFGLYVCPRLFRNAPGGKE
jgi:hypothetical protein